MRAGLADDDLIDVKVIDRIKDNYLDQVQQKMVENCKDVEVKKLTVQERQHKKEANEMNKIGVKAFQSKTTYELGMGCQTTRASPTKIIESNGRRSSVSHVEQWKL